MDIIAIAQIEKESIWYKQGYRFRVKYGARFRFFKEAAPAKAFLVKLLHSYDEQDLTELAKPAKGA